MIKKLIAAISKKPTPPQRISDVSLTLFGGNCYFHAPSHEPIHIEWNGVLDHQGTAECVVWTKNPYGEIEHYTIRGKAATILKTVATAFAQAEWASRPGEARKRAEKIMEFDKNRGHTEFLKKTTVPSLDQIATNSPWSI